MSRTEYCGNYVYENGNLRRIVTPEGYVATNNNVTEVMIRNTWRHRYLLKDHLGNTRRTLNANALNSTSPTVIPAGQLIDYYPFGLEITRVTNPEGEDYSPPYLAGATIPYLYNGKEIDRMHGLNWYDYGARFYDGAIVRWHGVDHLAEKYDCISPYAYCVNNPVNHVDPDGRLVVFINGMHNGFEGGKSKYWNGLDNRIMNRIGDQNAKYYDGASGGALNTASRGVLTGINLIPGNRRRDGAKMGYGQAKEILESLKDGETIKIVTHSMGGAYGKGFIKGMQKYANENNIDIKEKIEFEVDLAPFQPGSQKAVNGVPTITISHSGDIVAGSSPVRGANNNTTRQDQKPGFSEHSVDSFTQQEINDRVPRNPSTGDAVNSNKQPAK